MKILVVEDDELTRQMIKTVLDQRGYDILEASDGVEAIAVMEKHSISVVIADWMMPNMDGIELTKLISSDQSCYIYIIMLTSRSEDKDRIIGYEAGVDQYLKKPPNFQELEALIKIGKKIARPKKLSLSKIYNIDKKPKQSQTQEDTKEYTNGWIQAVYKIALSNKLITKEQFKELLLIIKNKEQQNQKVKLQDLIIEQNIIAPNKVKDLVNATRRILGRKFGSIAMEKGFISQNEFEKALKEQSDEFKKLKYCKHIDEIFIKNNLITEQQKNIILSEMELGEELEVNSEDIDETTVKDEASKIKDYKQNICLDEFDDFFELSVSEDSLKAYIRLKNESEMVKSITLEAIKEYLYANDIMHGIVDDKLINEFLKFNSDSKEKFLIAEGMNPVLGKNAYVTYHFDTEYLKIGTIKESGEIDYKDRGEVPKVNEGDLLAEKIPLKPGINGVDVHGNSIAVPEANDVKIQKGKGVEVSEDGLKIFASISGRPNLGIGGKISVFAELEIKEDVGFKTGNIEFDGNINVRGSINDDFSVKGGTLYAKDIGAADIIAQGDVTVADGIKGANIKAEGNVKAKFIHNAQIQAFGNIIVGKEIVDSEILTSGKILNERGTILSSFISARKGITSKNIGKDTSKPCKLNVDTDDHVKKVVKELETEIQQKRQVLEKEQNIYEKTVNEQQDTLTKMTEYIQVQERAMVQKKFLQEKLNSLKDKPGVNKKELSETEKILKEINIRVENAKEKVLRYIEMQENYTQAIVVIRKKIEKLVEEIENINKEKESIVEWSRKQKGFANVKVLGSINSGTKVSGPKSSKVLKETVKNVNIKEVKLKTDDDDPNSKAYWDMIIVKAR